MKKRIKKAEILLEYQNYIQRAPLTPQQMFGTACVNDGATVDRFGELWIKNIAENKKKFGSFAGMSVGSKCGHLSLKPAIVAGSGPSLKRNGEALRDRGDIPLISCLHNYHFFEDLGVKPDFYVTLDAQDITIEEVSEGGKKSEDEYWESTKDKTLLAYIGSSPTLLKKWKGEILFFNCPMPTDQVEQAVDAIEKFRVYVSSGGNVLGACLYLAKVIFGANPIAFVGADFSFSYDKKFHGWDSKYDKDIGSCVRTVDVFGNSVLTWQSYHGFKNFFDWVAENVPGIYINCTEGGTFGAYPTGNIMSVQQMDLIDLFEMYNMSSQVKQICENPQSDDKVIAY